MVTNFFKKSLKGIIVLLVLLLCALPFIQLVSEKIFDIPLLNIDNAMANLIFIFACFACTITWYNDKHIAIAAIDEFAPPMVKRIVGYIKAISIPCILVALFFSSWSELFIYFYPEDTIWGIPLRFVFACLPISYFVMVVMAVSKKHMLVFSIIGILLGLVIASGPISGVIYSVMYEFINPEFNYETLFGFFTPIFDAWISFASNYTAILIVFLVILAFLGVPLFIVISGITFVAFSQGGGYVEVLSEEVYKILTDKSIASIPLFTIAGYILSRGSAGKRLVDIFSSLFGWFKGGVVVATVIVAAFFTIFTGVSGVTILALGTLLTTVLTGVGADKGKSESLITSSGALGLLFPPSLAIIMYGTTNYFSVDVMQLFKGAIIPGILLGIGMITLGIFNNRKAATIPFCGKKLGEALKNGIFEMLLPIFIVVGYFTGLFTLFQSAAFAVLYSFVLSVVRKDFTLKGGLSVIIDSLPTTGGVLAIFGAAKGLSYFFLDASIPELLSDFVLTFVNSKIVFLLLLNLLLLVVGCLMDIYSAIMIVSPLLIPIAAEFGIHPVHMGVIFLMNMQLGFLTPPVGMDLFISSYAFDKPVMKVVRGVLPFLLVQFVILLLVTYIPWFTTALL